MEIRDRDIDRREERRQEEKKSETRRDVERRMQYEPMKTFEAKLAEKAAHELITKQSHLREAHDQKKSKEEKQSLVDKILGVATQKQGEEQKSRLEALKKQVAEQGKRRDDRPDDSEFKLKKEDSTATAKKANKGEGEFSAEGYRRVAEKSDDEGGLGGQNLSGGQQDADRGEARNSRRVGPMRPARHFDPGSFNPNPRSFTRKNLDEIVRAVRIGMNEHGEEEFTVELTDEYFNGLKVKATRTGEGVVVKFLCPNVSVRSTFLRFRLRVFAHLKKNNIDVRRVEVV